jgi:hypothetical protein
MAFGEKGVTRSHQYRTGLIHCDLDFSYRGYTLFCGGSPADAYLIDMQGRICHRWQIERGIQYANLLPNGHLLCRGTSSPEVQGLKGLNGQAPCAFELDWEGKLVWEFHDDWLHHDHERLPNGNTLLLAWRWLSKELTDRVQGGMNKPDDPEEMLADVILEVNGQGALVGQWSSWEHLDFTSDAICPIDHRLEWTHANSISTTPDGDWLVSFRRNDTIGAIIPGSGEFRWKWGRGTIAHQHDAKILSNGNLLVFDNGVHRQGDVEFSRVLEVDMAKDEIVWSYSDDPPFHFYSFMAGGADRLPNGNTLICDSAVGRFFEVTPGRDIVWEYVNPFYVNNPRLGGRINITFRAHRYGPDAPELAGKDLDPSKHANLNRLYAGEPSS